jgi:CheY-like chemotaxis protein
MKPKGAYRTPSRSWILVCEDDPDLSDAIDRCLKTGGYHVQCVDSAPKAIARIQNQKFDCMLVDIRLGNDPDGGRKIVLAAREDPGGLNYATPVILISGFVTEPIVRELADAIAGVLVKPFDIHALMGKVRECVAPPRPRD